MPIRMFVLVCVLVLGCLVSTVQAQKPKGPMPRHTFATGEAVHVAFSPDGRHCAVSSKSGVMGRLDVFRVDTGETLHDALPLDGPGGLRYSPDGTRLLVSAANACQLLDTRDYRQTSIIRTIVGYCINCDESSDLSRTLRVITEDRGQTSFAGFWNPASGQLIGKEVVFDKYSHWARISPDGTKAFALVGNTIVLLDPKTGAKVGEGLVHPTKVTVAAFTPDSASIVAADERAITVWDLGAGKPIVTTRQEGVSAFAFAPDGNIYLAARDKAAERRELKTGKQLGKAIRQPIVHAAYIRDGKLIVTAGFDQTVRLWNANTADPVGRPLPGNRFCVSPDEQTIATWRGGEVQLWDLPKQ